MHFSDFIQQITVEYSVYNTLDRWKVSLANMTTRYLLHIPKQRADELQAHKFNESRVFSALSFTLPRERLWRCDSSFPLWSHLPVHTWMVRRAWHYSRDCILEASWRFLPNVIPNSASQLGNSCLEKAYHKCDRKMHHRCPTFRFASIFWPGGITNETKPTCSSFPPYIHWLF